MNHKSLLSKSLQFSGLLFICFLSSQINAANPKGGITDIGVSAIITPVSGFGLGVETVTISIANYGTVTVSSFPVGLEVDYGAIISEEVDATIAPGDFLIYVFSFPCDLSILGAHEICAWTEMDDADPSNNSTCATVINYPKIADLGADTITNCGAYILDADNPGSSFLWNTGDTTQTITASETGMYWVKITPEGSVYADSDAVYLIIEPIPVADFSYINADLHVVFTNTSVEGETYLWDFGDGTSSTDENPEHAYSDGGLYDVTLSVTNDCGSSTASYTLNLATAIDQVKDDNFIIYPNPVENNLLFKVPLAYDHADLRIIDAMGRIILSVQLNQSISEIDVAQLPAGIYLAKINTGFGDMVKKWVKM